MSTGPIRFSDTIRGYVERSKLSRYEICKRTKIDQATFSRFMAGKGLSLQKLDALIDVLELDLVRYERLVWGDKFSDRLRHAVDKSGLSRYRICKKSDIDPAVISRFMADTAGRIRLSMKTLDALANALSLDLRTRYWRIVSSEKFSERVRSMVVSSRLLRWQICHNTGIPSATLSRFMAGKGSLSLQRLCTLADMLSLDSQNQKRDNPGKSIEKPTAPNVEITARPSNNQPAPHQPSPTFEGIPDGPVYDEPVLFDDEQPV